MPREIIAWCDVCYGAESETRELATHTETVTIGVGRPRLLLLCEADYKALVAPLTDALDRFGAPADVVEGARHGGARPNSGPKRSPSAAHDPRIDSGPIVCDECPPGKVSKNRRAFENHLSRTHNMGIVKYRELHGEPKAPGELSAAPAEAVAAIVEDVEAKAPKPARVTTPPKVRAPISAKLEAGKTPSGKAATVIEGTKIDGVDEKHVWGTKATCLECGQVYSIADGNKRPKQALSIHMARAHNVRSAKAKV